MLSRVKADNSSLDNALCLSEKLAYGYTNDRRDDKPYGRNYEMLCPKLGWEKVRVLYECNTDAVPALFPEGSEIPEEGIPLTFDGLELQVYRPQTGFGLGISGSCTGVRVAASASGMPSASASGSPKPAATKDAK